MMKSRKLLPAWKTKMESYRLLMDNSDTVVACNQYSLALSLVIIHHCSGVCSYSEKFDVSLYSAVLFAVWIHILCIFDQSFLLEAYNASMKQSGISFFIISALITCVRIFV
jgi:hypothetical protein